MQTKKPSILRIYGFATVVSIIALVLVGVNLGISALILVIILAALEITFSVDNAVINTRILQKMTPAWQRAFLTIGIIIAVFVVRLLLPLLIVALATDQSISSTIDLALNHPEEYGEKLNDAHPIIASFGGIFLLMLFMDFFFQRRRTKWLIGIETILQKAGKLESLSVLVSLTVLFWIGNVVPQEEQITVIRSGIAGLFVYLLINSFDTLLVKSSLNTKLQTTAQATFRAGLIGFIYLNLIDASFSLDGVIGAFAITNKIVLIAIGLGIGALFVRVVTVHMLRRGVLEQYKYVEHGAHYAIGVLAFIMLLSLTVDVPEFIAGLSGVVFISLAILQSYRESKRARKSAHA